MFPIPAPSRGGFVFLPLYCYDRFGGQSAYTILLEYKMTPGAAVDQRA